MTTPSPCARRCAACALALARARTGTPPPAEVLLGRPGVRRRSRRGRRVRAADRRVLVTGAAGQHRLAAGGAAEAAQPGAPGAGRPPRVLAVQPGAQRSAQAQPSAATSSPTFATPQRMRRVFEQHRPEFVFHLAAAKHVPYGERFPEGAVATNVLATQRPARACRRATSRRSSTRPATRASSRRASTAPPSASPKALVQQTRNGRRWTIVRYVNIIGTRGSVIETFTQQVLADRPLSVTDERMTRYWISMDEAVWSSRADRALRARRRSASCPTVASLCRSSRRRSRLAGWYRPERRAVSDRPHRDSTGRTTARGAAVAKRVASPTGPAPRPAPRADTPRPASARRAGRAGRGELRTLVERGERDAVARAAWQAADALQ